MSMLEIEFLTATLLLLSLNNSKCQCTSSGISFENARLTEQVIIKRSIETCHLFYKQICFNFWNNKNQCATKYNFQFLKYKKGFGEFEFSRTFLFCCPTKKSNFQNVKKCGKFKLRKCQKVRENSNSPNPMNPIASIIISYILCALKILRLFSLNFLCFSEESSFDKENYCSHFVLSRQTEIFSRTS